MNWVSDIITSNALGNDIHILSEKSTSLFEKKYLDIRKKEGRFYTIKELKQLPDVPKQHPLYKEWGIRKTSADKLISYLSSRVNPTTRILELGCGNGWLSNRFQKALKCNVLGVDMNSEELTQAVEVFGNEQLSFAYVDIFDDVIALNSFDFIVIPATAQYFDDLPKLISRLQQLCSSKGEIHLLDTPFYSSDEQVKLAKERTEVYYREHDAFELNAFYHHHQWNDLKSIPYRLMYSGDTIISKISRKFGFLNSPFPWIKI